MTDAMPAPKVLVRMMAQKRGLSLDDYARTTSLQEFLGEVTAWYSGFMVPLNTVMQALSPGEGTASPSGTALKQTSAGRAALMRQKYAGKKVTFYDLETPTGQNNLLYNKTASGLTLQQQKPKIATKPKATRLV